MVTIPYGRQDIDQADIDAVVVVLRSDFLTQGPAGRPLKGPSPATAVRSVRWRGAIEAEKKSFVFRRSLHVVQALRAGDALTRENVRAIRPKLELPPKYLEVVLGKAVSQDAKRGTASAWDTL